MHRCRWFHLNIGTDVACESVQTGVACVQDFRHADKDGDGIVSVGTFFSQHHPAPLTHIEHMFEISDCFGEVCMLYVGRTGWKHCSSGYARSHSCSDSRTMSRSVKRSPSHSHNALTHPPLIHRYCFHLPMHPIPQSTNHMLTRAPPSARRVHGVCRANAPKTR